MLKIFLDNINQSIKLSNYATDAVTFDFQASKEIHIGYFKPLKRIFIEMLFANLSTANISFKYFNGTTFVNADELVDETLSLKESGSIYWTQNESEKETTLHGEKMYWYKINTDADMGNIQIKGINLLFSNDIDLLEEKPLILENLGPLKSFINFHQASRNQIVQSLNNEFYLKYDGEFKQLTAFDLLEVNEVKEASKYLTLSKIYDFLSDQVGDKYELEARRFENLYGIARNSSFITLDSNNNGKADPSEKMTIKVGKVVRV